MTHSPALAAERRDPYGPVVEKNASFRRSEMCLPGTKDFASTERMTCNGSWFYKHLVPQVRKATRLQLQIERDLGAESEERSAAKRSAPALIHPTRSQPTGATE